MLQAVISRIRFMAAEVSPYDSWYAVPMARSMDIASFEPSDGVLNEQLRRKLNGNFRRVCEMVGTESPSVVASGVADEVMSRVPSVVNEAIEAWVDANLQTILDGSFDRSYPVGCVVVTTTASDPRLSRGRWQQVGAGRYVRAAGDGVPVMSEGGSDLIDLSMLPDHTHDVPVHGGAPDPGNPVTSLPLSTTGGVPNVTYGVTGLPDKQQPFEPSYLALLFYRRTQ